MPFSCFVVFKNGGGVLDGVLTGYLLIIRGRENWGIFSEKLLMSKRDD